MSCRILPLFASILFSVTCYAGKSLDPSTVSEDVRREYIKALEERLATLQQKTGVDAIEAKKDIKMFYDELTKFRKFEESQRQSENQGSWQLLIDPEPRQQECKYVKLKFGRYHHETCDLKENECESKMKEDYAGNVKIQYYLVQAPDDVGTRTTWAFFRTEKQCQDLMLKFESDTQQAARIAKEKKSSDKIKAAEKLKMQKEQHAEKLQQAELDKEEEAKAKYRSSAQYAVDNYCGAVHAKRYFLKEIERQKRVASISGAANLTKLNKLGEMVVSCEEGAANYQSLAKTRGSAEVRESNCGSPKKDYNYTIYNCLYIEKPD